MLMYVCPVHVEPKSIYVVHRSAFFSLLSVFLHWTLVCVWGISYCFWVDFPLIRAYHFIYSNTHRLGMESKDSIFGSPIFPRTVCFFDYECVQSRIYILFTSCRLNVFTVGRMELIPFGKGATIFWIATVDPTFMYVHQILRITIKFEREIHTHCDKIWKMAPLPIINQSVQIVREFFFSIPSLTLRLSSSFSLALIHGYSTVSIFVFWTCRSNCF